MAEDLNFFFPNSEIKRQVTLFNSELNPIMKKAQGQRANSLNIDKLKEIKNERKKYFSPALSRKLFKVLSPYEAMPETTREEARKVCRRGDYKTK